MVVIWSKMRSMGRPPAEVSFMAAGTLDQGQLNLDPRAWYLTGSSQLRNKVDRYKTR